MKVLYQHVWARTMGHPVNAPYKAKIRLYFTYGQKNHRYYGQTDGQSAICRGCFISKTCCLPGLNFRRNSKSDRRTWPWVSPALASLYYLFNTVAAAKLMMLMKRERRLEGEGGGGRERGPGGGIQRENGRKGEESSPFPSSLLDLPSPPLTAPTSTLLPPLNPAKGGVSLTHTNDIWKLKFWIIFCLKIYIF